MRPHGPFRADWWRSPLRGPWFTSVMGSVLLVGMPLLLLTGLLSYVAYNPGLGENDLTPGSGITGVFAAWPTSPSWLYRLNQGTHVTVGIILVPVVLAKLWSVMPKLFTWPPVRSAAQGLERLSVALLVGSVVFEIVTGLLNIQYWYVFPSSFYAAHLYGAYVFAGAFVVHVGLKLATMRRSLRERPVRPELSRGLDDFTQDPPDDTGLVAPAPQEPTISRRGALGLVGSGSALLLVLSAGQNLGGWVRDVALLSPRGRPTSGGPNAFPVNKTAEGRGITPEQIGPDWRLTLRGAGDEQTFSREDLLALPQHEAALAIACVEGWSTGVQAWSGVRLRDLAALAGAPDASSVFVESVETSTFGTTTLRGNQVADGDALLALGVNGVDLSDDHGYPARVVVPANPGVHNTKWVSRLTFEA
ncbi:molybdopterin-dependent oxidoreductase [Iamia majanohamensis]|uniref:Molybdopterin-dependent oxidoreductase n=1 Tax=Iamia majanohamensis TaxID=467976 RepID=A0AAE9Y7Z4_9ACTN|nr:molybdopterin-dependent oxidoreductase [Iamia majanohamensis]WCO68232.1 molybdopterin-dependent oxidoreductase [Iamia majanohamensis]